MESINEHYRLKNLEIEGSGGGGEIERNLHPKFKGKIKIRLWFYGSTNTGKKKQVEKSLRLMKVDPTTVTFQQIQGVAQKIHSKFNAFQLSLGKISFNYTEWDKGVQLQQMYLANQAEARKLVEQILDIEGYSPDWDFLNYTASVQPESRYPETPEKVVIAGQNIRTDQQRPLGTVKFNHAEILFPRFKSYEFLCDKEGNIIKDLDFIKERAD